MGSFMHEKPRLWLLLPALHLLFAGTASPQETSCSQIRSAVRMARARSIAALADERKFAGEGYRAEIVFAFRAFELHPTDRALAGALLGLFPQDDFQENIVMTLGDSLCNSESFSEMRVLARVRDGLPRMLSSAVMLVPDRMSAYVEYSLVATLNPHNDYATQMRRVCRRRGPEFKKAIDALPPAKREWLTTHVLDPQGCRAIALPESN